MPDAAQSSNDGSESIAQARVLATRAFTAQPKLAECDQETVDRIVGQVASVAAQHSEALAELAVKETGYGIVSDKTKKNLFAAQTIYDFIRPMKTVGVIRQLDDRRVVEIAEPFGVVAAIVPSTNPTSTTIYKLLIALKARCAIVISPHPTAIRSISQTVELLTQAAVDAGAPVDAISCMTQVSLEGTQALMQQREISVILATGGMGLVRAAYSAGKPAYGVGPGNAPAYIERSADVNKAVSDIIAGKTFDNGLLCSSENSVVVDRDISEAVRGQFTEQGGYFLNKEETETLSRGLITPEGLPNPKLVGRSATDIAKHSGINVPSDTKVLLAPLAGVGRDYPLSIEKLCPVLSFYTVTDWREGCQRCQEILRYGGMGHTMAIHSQNDKVILEFGLKKPAFRILVNTPTTLGSIGMTTGLDPSMTLGCGGHGGNITSDNISPRHLINVKRLAYETKPLRLLERSKRNPIQSKPPSGLTAQLVSTRVDEFLKTRGFQRQAEPHLPSDNAAEERSDSPSPLASVASPSETRSGQIEIQTVDFVSEEDVRRALSESRHIMIDDNTIVTPAAQDLANQYGVFEHSTDTRSS